MTIDKWKEILIRYLQEQGIVTDENAVWDLEAIDQLNGGKLIVWQAMLDAGKKISPVNYSRFVISYDEDIQNSADYKTYIIPATLGGRVSYIGTKDFKCKFREVSTIQSYNTPLKDMMPPIVRYIRNGAYVDVYNYDLEKSIGVNALVVNPLELASFNPDIDDYPFDESLKGSLCQAIYKTYYSFANTKKIDLTSDSKPQ